MRDEPFVGPEPFSSDDRDLFVGRDREAVRLAALIASERVVLFYAQSGVGKTSLVDARLAGDLEDDDYDVMVAQVGGASKLDVVPENVYVFNVLTRLAPERAHAELAVLTLAGFLEPESGEQTKPRVLILDQFEEILTTHPERRGDRGAFFHQLRRALEADPKLSILLVMREDKIAGLDEYAPLLPDQLRARLRMERLRRAEGVEAARRPVEMFDWTFAEEAAERLVASLSLEQVPGRQEPVEGEFVEPVQLQVVCLQLWKFVQGRPGNEITARDVDDFGDVGQALERFYGDTVTEAAGGDTALEARLRRWIEDELITPQGLRDQVDFDPDTDPSPFGKAVSRLVAVHLLRMEPARGGFWLQLINDRFVEPVRASNADWIPKYFPLAEDARQWQSRGRERSDLYAGGKLAEAQRLAKEQPVLAGPLEREFLETSQAAALASGRRWRALLLVALGLLAGVFFMYRVSKLQRQALARQVMFTARNELDTDPHQSLCTALEAAAYRPLDDAFDRDLGTLLRGGLHAFRLRPLWSRQTGPISALAWSPNGRCLAMADDTEVHLYLWDEESEEPRRESSFADPEVFLLAAGPDCTRLAVWDLDDHRGRLLSPDLPQSRPFSDETGFVNAAVFSPDGHLLATVGEDYPARLWDTETGALAATLGEAPGGLFCTFLRAGRQLAVAREGGVDVWDVDTAELIRTIDTADGEDVLAVAASPDGASLITAGSDGKVRIFEGDEDELAARLPHGEEKVLEVVASGDGEYLVTVALDGVVRAWDFFSRDEVLRVGLGHEQPVPGLTYSLSTSGRRLAQVSEESTVEVLEILLEDVLTLNARQDAVRTVRFSADGRLLATAGSDGLVKTWDAASGDLQKTFQGHTKRVNEVAWSTGGERLATASDDETSRVWEVSSGTTLHVLKGHTSPVTGVVLAPAGRRLWTASFDASLRMWDADSGAELDQWQADSPVNSLAGSSDATLLATAQSDGTAVVRSAETGEPLFSFAVDDGEARAVAFSPDDRFLAVAGDGGEVKVWDTRTRRFRFPSAGQAPWIQAIAFSPDGARLATASLRDVALWDATSGQRLAVLPERRVQMRDVAFSPDGARLASAGDDGRVRLELLRLEELIELAARRALCDPR